jgi:hypothetical protein
MKYCVLLDYRHSCHYLHRRIQHHRGWIKAHYKQLSSGKHSPERRENYQALIDYHKECVQGLTLELRRMVKAALAHRASLKKGEIPHELYCRLVCPDGCHYLKRNRR